MIIKGSLVLVTGASSGMGAAIAKAMANAGGRLVLLARRKETLDKVAADISSAGGEART
jgi:NADP-dependent 3-hydroxy acid dehydrogenase YdfG